MNKAEKRLKRYFLEYLKNDIPIGEYATSNQCIKDIEQVLNILEQLQQENQELKKKYENAVADYETTMFEKEQLNSLVNSCQEEIRLLKKQVEEYKNENKTLTKDKLEYLTKYGTMLSSQDKFIKYLEEEIQQQEIVIAENQEKSYFLIYEDEKDDLKLSSQKAYIKRIIFEEISQKYQEITGDDKK